MDLNLSHEWDDETHESLWLFDFQCVWSGDCHKRRCSQTFAVNEPRIAGNNRMNEVIQAPPWLNGASFRKRQKPQHNTSPEASNRDYRDYANVGNKSRGWQPAFYESPKIKFENTLRASELVKPPRDWPKPPTITNLSARWWLIANLNFLINLQGGAYPSRCWDDAWCSCCTFSSAL